MKKYLLLLTSLYYLQSVHAQAYTFHDYHAVTITGDTLDFSKYYRKKVMVVNTASYCGYTPQFAVLESLYEQYKQYNFEIIGFPCNDFGNQDPGNDSTINQFCRDYDVTFQMMSKVQIVTGDTAPVYKWLQMQGLNGVANARVDWNFNKFLIDEAGNWVRHFSSPVSPLDTAITNWIKRPSVLPLEAIIRADKPSACSGDTIHLGAEVFGASMPDPVLSFQWSTSGNSHLVQDSSEALLILGSSNDAKVQVQVTNENKMATNELTIANSGFDLDLIPSATNLPCGGSMNLVAWAHGSPASQEGKNYQWSPSASGYSIDISQAGIYSVTVTNSAGCSRSASVEIEDACATGISSGFSDADMQIYPNPATTNFQIRLSNSLPPQTYLQLYNSFGVLVREEKLSSATTTIYKEALSPGLYIWRLKNSENIMGRGRIILL